MSIKLSFIKPLQDEAFLSCIDEMESAFNKNASIRTYYSKSNFLKKIISRLLFKFPNLIFKIAFLRGQKKEINFAALLGLTFDFLLPRFYFSRFNYVYMFDAWPRFHSLIIKYAEFLNIRIIFFSSKEVTKRFNEKCSASKGIWIPEGIDINSYFSLPYASKDIDVLEFGRKYDSYHDLIKEKLKKVDKTHLYEIKKGEVVFRTNEEFLNGLARTKITICVPSNITHPERAEDISTMTLRYLQSMASNCLIVGIMPDEMRELFDYLPIIEIDINNPAGQLIDLLNNFDRYIPLIEKNYQEVKNSHTWNRRLEQMLDIIKNDLRK